ncbi:MAG: hypothetical protein H8E15_15855 [Planctomycetes bacterium]|nr:hypothetical protein [Planctomycetota bacterium]
MASDPKLDPKDPSPDEIQNWVEELQPLRWQGWGEIQPTLPQRPANFESTSKPLRRMRWQWMSMAAAVLLSLYFWWPEDLPESESDYASGFVVRALMGRPELISAKQGPANSINSNSIAISGQNPQNIGIGSKLITPKGARARVGVGEIGEVILEENSALSVADSSAIDGEYLLRLEQGKMVASIFAAPRIFQVDTPGGIAVDLGCIYETEILSDRITQLRVVAGLVSFESQGRSVVVPSGAYTWAYAGSGPVAPVRDEASGEFAAAWKFFVDREVAATTRQAALVSLVEHAQAKDGITLWYLLRDCEEPYRRELALALNRLAPAPDGAILEQCATGEGAALERWRAAYGW